MDLKKITDILKAKQQQAQDTMYNRQEFLDNINKITRGEMKPSNKTVTAPVKTASGKKKYFVKDNNGNDIEMTKEEFEGFVKRRGININK